MDNFILAIPKYSLLLNLKPERNFFKMSFDQIEKEFESLENENKNNQNDEKNNSARIFSSLLLDQVNVQDVTAVLDSQLQM